MSTLKISSIVAHKASIIVTTFGVRRSDAHVFYTKKFKSMKAADAFVADSKSFPFINTEDWEFIGVSAY